jgi:hypothetical protein
MDAVETQSPIAAMTDPAVPAKFTKGHKIE